MVTQFLRDVGKLHDALRRQAATRRSTSMSSRKELKEQRRREREAKERAAQAAQGRQRRHRSLIGCATSTSAYEALVVTLVVVMRCHPGSRPACRTVVSGDR